MMGRARLVLAGLVVGLLACAAAAALARAPTRVDWMAGHVAGRRASRTPAIDGLACPSDRLCLGVDQAGAVLRTTTPGRNRGLWRRLPQPGAEGLDAIACPTIRFCAAVGARDSGPESGRGAGRILTTDHPVTATRWRRSALPARGPGGSRRSYEFEALSCPSARLCVAAADSSGLLVSTHPAAGARAWHEVDLGARSVSAEWWAVSCPSARFCVAGDLQDGRVAVSTDPAGGRRAWHLSRTRSGERALHGITALSCPTRRFCVAGGEQGGVRWSADPAGGPRAWHLSEIDPPPGHLPLEAVSCRSARFCVAIDATHLALVSTDPRRGAAAWHRTQLDTGHFPLGALPLRRLAALACSPHRVCVVGGDVGDVFPGRTS